MCVCVHVCVCVYVCVVNSLKADEEQVLLSCVHLPPFVTFEMGLTNWSNFVLYRAETLGLLPDLAAHPRAAFPSRLPTCLLGSVSGAYGLGSRILLRSVGCRV